jgi:hypothetical protein
MQPDKEMMERVTALTSELIDILLPELTGENPMRWDYTVLAGAMAIKAVGMMAGQIHQLDADEIKTKLSAAVMCGLRIKVNAVACKTKDEFDAMCAAQEGPVH